MTAPDRTAITVRIPRYCPTRRPLPQPVKPPKRVALVGWITSQTDYDRRHMDQRVWWTVPLFWSSEDGQQQDTIVFSLVVHPGHEQAAQMMRRLKDELRSRGFTHWQRTVNGSVDHRLAEEEL